MTNSSPVAVFGASGVQGGAVARAFLAAGRPVRALSRDAAAVSALVENGAEHAAADLSDPSTIARALDGVGAAFVMVPFDAPPDVHARFVTAALAGLRAAHVPQAVFTLSGPVPTDDTGAASLDARRAAARRIADSGLPVITFAPGGYLGNLLGPWVAPAILQAGQIPYPLPADLARPWVSVEDQASLAVAALDRPDLAGRTFTIGHRATGTDLAAAVGEALGRPVQWVTLDLEAFAESLVPVIGQTAAHELATEYRLTAQHPAVAEAPLDYDAAPRELSVSLTPLATWAAAQDWQAAGNPPTS